VVGPIARREAVGWLQARGTSLRRACRVIGLSTATWRYQRRSSATNVTVLTRLQAHAAVRARFGYRRLHILLAREGLAVNHKRVHRIYQAAGLPVRRRRRKRLTRAERVPLPPASQGLERWSMDFTADTLADGRHFRTLNIVDDFSRECSTRGRMPVASRCASSDRASRSRTRTSKAFNGKFRDECLNEHWFVNLVDAKATLEAWRIDYNTVRPHSSLAGRTPAQFAAIAVGARRLPPARPDEGLKPEGLALSV
jgi:putative transposase